MTFSLRIILVSFFSFFKRLFFFSPSFYQIISFLPLLAVVTSKLSKLSIFIVIAILAIVGINGLVAKPEAYAPLCLLLLTYPLFKRVDYEVVLTKIFPFFLASCAYGLYQFFFGYSLFEINWINSGLGFATSESLIDIGVTRPFSFFASMADFALFLNIYLYFFLCYKKYLYCLITFAIILIVGSRGMIIGTFLAVLSMYLNVKPSRNIFLFLPILCALPYMVLLFSSESIIANESLPFLFNPGSLIGRTAYLSGVITDIYAELPFSLLGFSWNSIGLDSFTLDNMYVFSLVAFGLPLSLILMFSASQLQKTKKSLYFLILFFTYGYYSDSITSFYLMFLFFFAFFSIQPKLSTFK